MPRMSGAVTLQSGLPSLVAPPLHASQEMACMFVGNLYLVQRLKPALWLELNSSTLRSSCPLFPRKTFPLADIIDRAVEATCPADPEPPPAVMNGLSTWERLAAPFLAMLVFLTVLLGRWALHALLRAHSRRRRCLRELRRYLRGPLQTAPASPFAVLAWVGRRSDERLALKLTQLDRSVSLEGAASAWENFVAVEGVFCGRPAQHRIADFGDLMAALGYLSEHRTASDALDGELAQLRNEAAETTWAALQQCFAHATRSHLSDDVWHAGVDQLIAALVHADTSDGTSSAAKNASRAWTSARLRVGPTELSVDEALTEAAQRAPHDVVRAARANAASLLVWAISNRAVPDPDLCARAMSRWAVACRTLGRSMLAQVDLERARLVAGLEVLAALETGAYRRHTIDAPVAPPTPRWSETQTAQCFLCGEVTGWRVSFRCSSGHVLTWCGACERSVRRGSVGTKFLAKDTPCLLNMTAHCAGVCVEASRAVRGGVKSLVAA